MQVESARGPLEAVVEYHQVDPAALDVPPGLVRRRGEFDVVPGPAEPRPLQVRDPRVVLQDEDGPAGLGGLSHARPRPRPRTPPAATCRCAGPGRPGGTTRAV